MVAREKLYGPKTGTNVLVIFSSDLIMGNVFSVAALNLILLTPRFSEVIGPLYDHNRFSGLPAQGTSEPPAKAGC
jgi:hypothetical protein